MKKEFNGVEYVTTEGKVFYDEYELTFTRKYTDGNKEAHIHCVVVNNRVENSTHVQTDLGFLSSKC